MNLKMLLDYSKESFKEQVTVKEDLGRVLYFSLPFSIPASFVNAEQLKQKLGRD